MKFVLCVSSIAVVALFGAFAAPAQADQCDDMTYLTFNEPVGLPGVTLPPGTYRFEHLDCDMNTHLLRVSSRDGLKIYATLVAIPVERETLSSQPEVVFAKMPAGSPEAIKAWFYPGEEVGDQLVYPKAEESVVADAVSQKVFAVNGAL